MTHICRFLPHKTQSTGREYRACPICGNTPAQTIILTVPDHVGARFDTTVCAGQESTSVGQRTEPCYSDVAGEAHRRAIDGR